VRGLKREAEAWRVHLGEESWVAERVFLCPGGKSYARAGTTGDGYAWLAALGLPCVEPVPALVPLASPAGWVRELAGISLQEVEVRLVAPDGRELGRRARPIVFTHHGVSGPGAMDLSEPVARAAQPLTLRLDLLPIWAREDLRARLLESGARSGAPLLANVVSEELVLPRRLVEQVLAQAGIAPELRVNLLKKPERHALVEALKGLDVPVDGTLGFDAAEVTAGGLALEALDPGTLRVRGCENLWAFGELIDLQGPIGGLNFQAAFATAELAARSVAVR
jgi:hypothetical protein